MLARQKSLSALIATLILLLICICSSNQSLQIYPTTYELIKQNEECRLLKMIKDDDNIYFPDDEKLHNTLDDKHYQKLNLKTKTFDEAMNFYRSMLANLTTGCKSKQCECTRSLFVEQDLSTYNVLFSSETNFSQTKRIVSSFLNKYKSDQLSTKIIIENEFKEEKEYILPTLMGFFVNFDFTINRVSFYNESVKCETEDLDNYVSRCNLLKRKDF